MRQSGGKKAVYTKQLWPDGQMDRQMELLYQH